MGNRGPSSFCPARASVAVHLFVEAIRNLIRRPAAFDAWRGDAEHASGGLCSCCNIQGRMCERRLLVLRTFPPVCSGAKNAASYEFLKHHNEHNQWRSFNLVLNIASGRTRLKT